MISFIFLYSSLQALSLSAFQIYIASCCITFFYLFISNPRSIYPTSSCSSGRFFHPFFYLVFFVDVCFIYSSTYSAPNTNMLTQSWGPFSPPPPFSFSFLFFYDTFILPVRWCIFQSRGLSSSLRFSFFFFRYWSLVSLSPSLFLLLFCKPWLPPFLFLSYFVPIPPLHHHTHRSTLLLKPLPPSILTSYSPLERTMWSFFFSLSAYSGIPPGDPTVSWTDSFG